MMQPVDAAEHEHRVRSVQYYLPIGDEEKEAFERRFSVRCRTATAATESICWRSPTCRAARAAGRAWAARGWATRWRS